jgi:hypothetical protein
MTEHVRITRRGSDIGTNDNRRVYVTGPHFGADIFSSTDDPNEPDALFDRAEAEAYVREGKWRHLDPAIEPLADEEKRGS